MLRIGRGLAVYVPDMIKSFDYFFGSVRAVDGVADFSTPRHHQLIGFEDFPVLFPSMPEPYETTKQYLAFASLKPGDVVLDLGAYAGVTSIVFARAVGFAGAVFALEPDPESFRTAMENIKTAHSFGYPPVTLTNEAAWSHNEGLDFSVEGAMGASAVSIVGAGRGSIIRVPTTTLSKFVEKRKIGRIDFIKMDIEGAEIEVLDSSRDLLSRMRPKIIIEPHFVAGLLATERCCQILNEIGGYEIRIVDQPGVFLPLIEARKRGVA